MLTFGARTLRNSNQKSQDLLSRAVSQALTTFPGPKCFPFSRFLPRIDVRDIFESHTRLRIGHVMQERHSAIEFGLGPGRAAYREVDRAHHVAGALS